MLGALHAGGQQARGFCCARPAALCTVIGEVELVLERETAARGGAEASREDCMGQPDGAAEGAFAKKERF